MLGEPAALRDTSAAPFVVGMIINGAPLAPTKLVTDAVPAVVISMVLGDPVATLVI